MLCNVIDEDDRMSDREQKNGQLLCSQTNPHCFSSHLFIRRLCALLLYFALFQSGNPVDIYGCNSICYKCLIGLFIALCVCESAFRCTQIAQNIRWMIQYLFGLVCCCLLFLARACVCVVILSLHCVHRAWKRDAGDSDDGKRARERETQEFDEENKKVK